MYHWGKGHVFEEMGRQQAEQRLGRKSQADLLREVREARQASGDAPSRPVLRKGLVVLVVIIALALVAAVVVILLVVGGV